MGRLSAAKQLGLIASGYVLSIAGGIVAVALNEALMPADISESSGGMVAFGDMILFVLATGFCSLLPTWFLLKLAAEKAPRALLAVELLIAATGPASWLAVMHLAVAPVANPAQTETALLGLFIAFGAIPRIVAGPVLVAIEGVTLFLVRQRVGRALLGAAMLMDLVPLSIFALHMSRAVYR
jgi:hypothetical protein